ncbi:MAG: YidC/Oxa1 family membrane protein insertase [Chloroflexi bacterium]|nr:YidC/Oxa1 family membrane protein insertase [Chloroflexota bacterium]
MGFLNLILLQPILNILLVLTHFLFSNFGLGVIALTIIIRLILLPLTLMQLRSSKKTTETMNAIKPKLEQLKKKLAKNPQKLQQETMKLYKEAGISPLGCLSSPMLLSTVIQLPIYIALYRAIIQGLAVTPQDFLGLSQNLYSWGIVSQGLPISGHFLWLNLAGNGDPYFVLPVLVGVTQWVSQKMITQPGTDPQQQSMNTMMQIMMPLMMAFMTITFPAGLGLYFLVTSLVMMVIQYFVYGWGGLFAKAPAPAAGTKKDGKSEKVKGTTRDVESESETEGAKSGGGGLGGLLSRARARQADKKKSDKTD